jgi:hypothetical protein
MVLKWEEWLKLTLQEPPMFFQRIRTRTRGFLQKEEPHHTSI